MGRGMVWCVNYTIPYKGMVRYGIVRNYVEVLCWVGKYMQNQPCPGVWGSMRWEEGLGNLSTPGFSSEKILEKHEDVGKVQKKREQRSGGWRCEKLLEDVQRFMADVHRLTELSRG